MSVSLSVSLSVCWYKFSRSRVFFSLKYPSNGVKCWKTALYVLHFARYTLKALKSFWVSIMGMPINYTQMLRHVLNVQHEKTVSVSLGFTIQHALVRQQFYPHGSTCIATLVRGICALQSSNAARQQQRGWQTWLQCRPRATVQSRKVAIILCFENVIVLAWYTMRQWCLVEPFTN